jgi:hypothetical protein
MLHIASARSAIKCIISGFMADWNEFIGLMDSKSIETLPTPPDSLISLPTHYLDCPSLLFSFPILVPHPTPYLIRFTLGL